MADEAQTTRDIQCFVVNHVWGSPDPPYHFLVACNVIDSV